MCQSILELGRTRSHSDGHMILEQPDSLSAMAFLLHQARLSWDEGLGEGSWTGWLHWLRGVSGSKAGGDFAPREICPVTFEGINSLDAARS